jgi:hypothetical protein
VLQVFHHQLQAAACALLFLATTGTSVAPSPNVQPTQAAVELFQLLVIIRLCMGQSQAQQNAILFLVATANTLSSLDQVL